MKEGLIGRHGRNALVLTLLGAIVTAPTPRRSAGRDHDDPAIADHGAEYGNDDPRSVGRAAPLRGRDLLFDLPGSRPIIPELDRPSPGLWRPQSAIAAANP